MTVTQERVDEISQANHRVLVEARDLVQCFPVDISDGESVAFNIPSHRVERLRDAIRAAEMVLDERSKGDV